MISADIHTHTNYFHGKNTVQEMYDAAVVSNLRYYGFSEHTPLPEGFSCLLYQEGDMNAAFENYVNDVLTLKEKVADCNKKNPRKIPEVLLGMELDFTPQYPDYMDTLIKKYPFDYVIGTVHFVGEQNIGLWDAEGAGLEEKYAFFEEYYNYMIKLTKYGKTDIIAHPDFVKIHCIDSFHAWLKTKRASECLHETCEAIKKSGMVLEVSTGGLKKACKEIHPSPKILEIAASYAIPISFASDTHNIDTVAYKFEELAQFARQFGYKEHTIFINRQPVRLVF